MSIYKEKPKSGLYENKIGDRAKEGFQKIGNATAHLAVNGIKKVGGFAKGRIVNYGEGVKERYYEKERVYRLAKLEAVRLQARRKAYMDVFGKPKRRV